MFRFASRRHCRSCRARRVQKRQNSVEKNNTRVDVVSLENKTWYFKNRANVLEKYKGKWIAVEDGRVTCAQEDYNTFLDELNKTEIKSPYLCLCGKEDYAFPVVPVNYYDAYLDNFLPGDVQHPDENKALPDFTPYGFFKQSRTRSVDADHLPPPYRPFLTLPIKNNEVVKSYILSHFLLTQVLHKHTYVLLQQKHLDYLCSTCCVLVVIGFILATPHFLHNSLVGYLGINLLGTDVLYRGVLTVDFERRKLLFSSELMSL